MSPITTHVLDITHGLPAEGLEVDLDSQDPKGNWKHLAKSKTDSDGRVKDFLPEDHILARGVYRMIFATGPYLAQRHVEGFYPSVTITFEVRENRRYHVPLLLSPFGYSTYRGS